MVFILLANVVCLSLNILILYWVKSYMKDSGRIQQELFEMELKRRISTGNYLFTRTKTKKPPQRIIKDNLSI